MQKALPPDMSIPDRVAVLERRLDRLNNRRKVQNQTIDEIAQYLEVVMDFLDGSTKVIAWDKVVKFNRKEIKMRFEMQQIDREDAEMEKDGGNPLA